MKTTEQKAPDEPIDAIASIKRSLADLEKRHAEATADIAAIVERRKPLALKALQGDKTASAELDKLTGEEYRAGISHRDLGFAVDAVKADLANAEHVAAEADADARLAGAKAFGAELIAQSEIFDRAIAEASAALHKRAALIDAMMKTGGLAFENRNSLLNKGRLARALGRGGIGAFTDAIERSPNNATLADADRGTISTIRRPEVKRVVVPLSTAA